MIEYCNKGSSIKERNHKCFKFTFELEEDDETRTVWGTDVYDALYNLAEKYYEDVESYGTVLIVSNNGKKYKLSAEVDVFYNVCEMDD